MKFLSLILCICLLLLNPQMSMSFTKDRASDSQYPFIENKGQVMDQNGHLRSDVKFLYDCEGFKLILREHGFSYEFTRTVADNGDNTESGQQPQSLDEEEDVVIPDVHFVSNRIDVDLLNCNMHADIIPAGASSFYKNYFNGETGPTGITFIRSFQKITYRNIYPGIDLVFYTRSQPDGKVFPEYEFVVSPSGDMSAIRLSYSGQDNVKVAEDGSLQTGSALGFINESRPMILFPGKLKNQQGGFILNGTTASFKNVKHGKDETFVIDPTIAWGTYYGGTDKDIPDEIASDSQLNIYLAGRTGSTSMIATAGAQKTIYSGGDDVALIKFDTEGNLLWATYHGGHGNDVPFAITVDPFDNVYIGGRTSSADGIATAGAVIDTVSGGYFDVFIAKFTSAGILQWGTYMGGDLKDEVQGMATNPVGELYVSGYSESLYGIATPGTYKSVGDTAGESFLMKFTPDGHQLWGTYYGGKNRDRGHGVWVNNGHVYQVGTTNSKNGIATPGSYQDTYIKQLDAFLAQWTEDGHLDWATYFGGEGDDRPRDVRTDDAGNLYFGGQTESETGIATTGTWKSALQYQPHSNRDGFIEKFSPAGFRIWGTYFGGNFIEMPRSLRVGHLGTPIWLGGYTKSDSGLSTKGSFNKKLGGKNDGFIAKFNWDGSQLMYASYYGGKKSESITAGGWYGSPMDMDREGNIYLSSCTQSPDSIATPGAYKTILSDTTGEYDFFMVKFTDPCSDPFEPNDTVTHVPSLYFNPTSKMVSVHAQIQKKKDKDYFTFYLKDAMQKLKITLTNLPLDCNIFLYDSTQTLVAKSQNIGLADEEIVDDTAHGGKYYVLIKAVSPFPFDAVNCYTLSVAFGDSAFRTTAAEEQMVSAPITLYPNPASDVAVLVMTAEKQGTARLEITDLAGHRMMVFNHNIIAGENDLDIPVNKLAGGNYIIKLTCEGQQQMLKMEVVK